MKQLISVMALSVPSLAIAHTGHTVTEQFHMLLHSEHLAGLIAITLVIATVGIIKKFK